MRKYPFSPELLEALPEELVELFQSLEDVLLLEICSRLSAADQLNQVTVDDIKALRSHGIDPKEIKRAIKKTVGIGEDKLNKLLDDVVDRNQKYYTEVIDIAKLTKPDVIVEAAEIAAIVEQCQREYGNITRSMGFLVDNGRTMLEPAKAYQWACDNAVLQIQSGAISYNQAIESAVTQLSKSGLKSVDYESGHVSQVDTAVRRAVMTGVNQLNRKFTEQSMDFLETDLVEVSAHYGARNIDGPNGWENHEKWQGKLYRWETYTRRYSGPSKGQYPDFEHSCGYGDVTGILGANCRHSYHPYVEGVMEPTYSQDNLERMKGKNNKVVFDGKEYDGYQATQMQRRLEASIRKQRRLKNAYKAAGLKEDATAANAKLRRLNAKYTEFSAAAGLPERKERMKATYPDDRATEQAKKMAERRASEVARAASDDEEAVKYFGANSEADLKSIVKRGTVKLENGFSCFPDDDPLTEYVKEVKPLKTYYDVALHGTPTAVCFGTTTANMSPRVLASVIRHSNGWNGQKIRLLSCSTGVQKREEYCFAEELANALGVEVKAPNGMLFITHKGTLYVGKHKEGSMVPFIPNQRGRRK